MTLYLHELRQNWKSCLIWSLAIGLLCAFCLSLYPDMKSQTDSISSMFAGLGSFSAAFGLDRLNLGTLPGFYAVECGSILGIGGGLYAAWLAADLLSKEEVRHTAEFLLTQPVSRTEIYWIKLAALLSLLILLNLAVTGMVFTAIKWMHEALPAADLFRINLSCFLMQIEIAGICYGLSAFCQKSFTGPALGLAGLLYAISLLANLSDSLNTLSWLTPYGYCDGAWILSHQSMDLPRILTGMLLTAGFLAAGFLYYRKKDIH